MFTKQQIYAIIGENRKLFACCEMYAEREPDDFFIVKGGKIVDHFEAYDDDDENLFYRRSSITDLFTTDWEEMVDRLMEDRWIIREVQL